MLSVGISIIVGILLPAIKRVISRNENWVWGIKNKQESDFFYAWLIIFSFIESIIVGFLYLSIYVILFLFLKTANLFILTPIFIGILYFIIHFHLKRYFIRKRLLCEKKIHKILACIPLVIMSCDFMLLILGISNSILNMFFTVLFISAEILGFIAFWGKYNKYDYSFANLYFSDGTRIMAVDVEKIKKNSKWILIEGPDKEIRVKAETLKKIEYYGEPKISLKSFLSDISLHLGT